MKSAHPETHAEYTIRQVGYVKSDIKKPSLKVEGTELTLDQHLENAAEQAHYIRNLQTELIINPEYDGILEGLESFSHAIILYWPHLLSQKGDQLIKVHPMGQKAFPKVGIYSTCSPARPNPILATAVRVIKRTENRLTVQGLEAVDGSPIIDIKPFTRNYFGVKDVTVADWMEKIEEIIKQSEK